MLNLVHIRNDQAVTSSRTVAEIFDKEHRHVLESIREILTAEKSAVNLFFENSYLSSRGKFYPEYLMNRDGFCLLAMGFTGQKALHFKMAYINAFNAMEEELQHLRSEQFVHIDNDEDRIVHAIEFAEKLSKKLLWISGSEEIAKMQAVEISARKFNLDMNLFSFILSKSTEFEVLYVTEIGRILGIEANDVIEPPTIEIAGFLLLRSGFIVRLSRVSTGLTSRSSYGTKSFKAIPFLVQICLLILHNPILRR